MKQRLLTVMLLTVCIVLGVIGFFLYVGQDKRPPEISLEEMSITYREGDNYDVLLKGIKAKDNRDGDLSNKVFVDRIIPTENGKAVVYYGVVDSNKNVGTAARIVTYTADVQADKNEDVDAADVDTENETQPSEENKKQETISDEKKLTPEGEAPVIALNTDHVTIAAGSEFDPLSAVQGVADTIDDADTLSQQISVEGEYDIYTPGDYNLSYYVTDSDGNTSEVITLTLTIQ